MTQPFVGQIQAYGFDFAPRYWAQCNGQLLSIQQNTALFALLGTTYGGNGVNTFQLPNLQSRVPMHAGTFNGTTYGPGETGGEEQIMLNINSLPLHNHQFYGSSSPATATAPSSGAVMAQVAEPSTGQAVVPFYGSDATPIALNSGSLKSVGGNLPHTNIQPYLAINFCIALYGIFPSRS